MSNLTQCERLAGPNVRHLPKRKAFICIFQADEGSPLEQIAISRGVQVRIEVGGEEVVMVPENGYLTSAFTNVLVCESSVIKKGEL